MMSGGSSRTTLSPGAHGQQTGVAQPGDHLGIGLPAFQAEQQPCAADLLEDLGMAARPARRGRGAAAGAIFCTRSKNPVASITSSTALATAMASGLPPKVLPWLPARQRAGGLLLGEARADGKAAAQPLGRRHDVGLDAGPFMGEELAGAAHAALDLVEEQQQAVFVADGAQALQIFARGRAQAAFALHRLDQDRGGLAR